MSTKIGGPHRCNIHPDFPETDDQDVWNEHCANTEGHTISGTVPCITCKTSIELSDIPYQRIGEETRLQCPDCFNKTQDLNKLVNSSQSQKINIEEFQQQ